MDSSRIHIANVGVNTVMTMKESITYQTRDALKEAFDRVVEKNRNRVVLDFRAVPFIDSEGLELLLFMHDSLTGSGGILKLAGLNAVCRDILLVTRLVNMLHVFNDLPEALRGEM